MVVEGRAAQTRALATMEGLTREVSEQVLRRPTDLTAIVAKAMELQRKMSFKVPKKALGKGEAVRHVVAVDLACRVCGVPYDKVLLASKSSLNGKDYQQIVNVAKNYLELVVVKVAPLEILSIQFDAALKAAALEVLEDYSRLYVSKLDAARSSNIDLSSDVYQAAAFLVASVLRNRKPALDRKRIIEVAEVDPSAFKTVEKSLMAVLAPNEKDGTDKKKVAVGVKKTSSKGSLSSSSSSAAAAASSSSSSLSSSLSQAKNGVGLIKPKTISIRPIDIKLAAEASMMSEAVGAAALLSSENASERLMNQARHVGAIQRNDEEKRRASLGLLVDTEAQRAAVAAAAAAEAQRKKDEERASFELYKTSLLTKRKRKQGTE